jgi:hypothetical protein
MFPTPDVLPSFDLIDLFNLGEQLYSIMLDVGNFLLSTPFNFVQSILDQLSSISPVFETVVSAFPQLNPALLSQDYTIASFLIGSGLIFIICWRFVKFFTDVIL